MQALNYASATTPPEYRCTGCGASGVKLWRLPHGANDLLNCVDCMCKREDLGGDPIDPKSVSEEGDRDDRFGRSDQIAGLLPAVPDEEGVSFWGYSSVPEAGVKWWRALPLRGNKPAVWRVPRRRKTRAKPERAIVRASAAEIRSVDPRLLDTFFVVEATDFEQFALWERWHDAIEWVQDGAGLGIAIGHVARHPVVVSLVWATIQDKRILFIHDTSRVVDHQMIDTWLERHCFPRWDNGERRARTNAANFHHVINALGVLGEARKKAYPRPT